MRDVAIWPLKLMRLTGYCNVTIVVDENGGHVAMWLQKLMRLEGMSWCGN